jgi:hypothetical protein
VKKGQYRLVVTDVLLSPIRLIIDIWQLESSSRSRSHSASIKAENFFQPSLSARALALFYMDHRIIFSAFNLLLAHVVALSPALFLFMANMRQGFMKIKGRSSLLLLLLLM